jgi:hypothetical protein
MCAADDARMLEALHSAVIRRADSEFRRAARATSRAGNAY